MDTTELTVEQHRDMTTELIEYALIRINVWFDRIDRYAPSLPKEHQAGEYKKAARVINNWSSSIDEYAEDYEEFCKTRTTTHYNYNNKAIYHKGNLSGKA